MKTHSPREFSADDADGYYVLVALIIVTVTLAVITIVGVAIELMP